MGCENHDAAVVDHHPGGLILEDLHRGEGIGHVLDVVCAEPAARDADVAEGVVSHEGRGVNLGGDSQVEPVGGHAGLEELEVRGGGEEGLDLLVDDAAVVAVAVCHEMMELWEEVGWELDEGGPGGGGVDVHEELGDVGAAEEDFGEDVVSEADYHLFGDGSGWGGEEGSSLVWVCLWVCLLLGFHRGGGDVAG